MMYRYISTLFAALCLLFLAACPSGGQKAAKGDEYTFDTANANVPKETKIYPHYLDRPYTDIHEDAQQAWFLVETSYLVVKDKYDRAQKLKESSDPAEQAEGQKLYEEVVGEVQTVIFGTNATVEQLFKSAIEAQPSAR